MNWSKTSHETSSSSEQSMSHERPRFIASPERRRGTPSPSCSGWPGNETCGAGGVTVEEEPAASSDMVSTAAPRGGRAN